MLNRSQYKFRIKLPFKFYKSISEGKLKSKDVLVYLSITQDSNVFEKSERMIALDTGLSRKYVQQSIKRLKDHNYISSVRVQKQDIVIDGGVELEIWNPYYKFDNGIAFWDRAKKSGEKFRLVRKYALLLPTSAKMCDQVFQDIHYRQRTTRCDVRPIDLVVFLFLSSRHPDHYRMNITRDSARCGIALNTFKKSVHLLQDLHLITVRKDSGITTVYDDHLRIFVRTKDKLQTQSQPALPVEPFTIERINFLRKDLELLEDKEEFNGFRDRMFKFTDGQIPDDIKIELLSEWSNRKAAAGF